MCIYKNKTEYVLPILKNSESLYRLCNCTLVFFCNSALKLIKFDFPKLISQHRALNKPQKIFGKAHSGMHFSIARKKQPSNHTKSFS